MTPRSPVSGPAGRRLAVTLIAGIVCLSLGLMAMPELIAARLAAAGRLDPECSAKAESHRCLVWRAEAARKTANFEEATRLARRAIAQEPLDTDALEILARSQDPRQVAALRRLIARIARLTLHNSFSHVRLMEDAFAGRRWDQALFHSDVLLRRQVVRPETVYGSIFELLNTEAGRVAIAKRLATDPPWRMDFLRAVASKASAAEAMALLSTMTRRGLAPTPVEAEFLVSRLLGDNQYDAVRRLRGGMLSKGQARSLVYDGEFEGLPGPTSFTWQARSLSGGEAILGSPETDYPGMLLLRHDLFSSSDWMAQQLIVLSPGRYRLTVAARGLDDQGSRRFVAEINCRGGGSLFTLPLATAGDDWIASKADFDVPAEGCQAQWIVFRPVTGDRVESARVLVDHVRLAPSTAALSAQPLVQLSTDAR